MDDAGWGRAVGGVGSDDLGGVDQGGGVGRSSGAGGVADWILTGSDGGHEGSSDGEALHFDGLLF